MDELNLEIITMLPFICWVLSGLIVNSLTWREEDDIRIRDIFPIIVISILFGPIIGIIIRVCGMWDNILIKKK